MRLQVEHSLVQISFKDPSICSQIQSFWVMLEFDISKGSKIFNQIFWAHNVFWYAGNMCQKGAKKLICTNLEWKAEGASHLTISIKQKVGEAPSGRSPSHPLSIHFLSLTDFQQGFESWIQCYLCVASYHNFLHCIGLCTNLSKVGPQPHQYQGRHKRQQNVMLGYKSVHSFVHMFIQDQYTCIIISDFQSTGIAFVFSPGPSFQWNVAVLPWSPIYLSRTNNKRKKCGYFQDRSRQGI